MKNLTRNQRVKNQVRKLLIRAGFGKKKIFAIGFNKSGTQSLHSLFTSLGLLSYHGEKWRSCDDLKLLRSYEAFSDDIPENLPKLDNIFPGSRFILQVRELESWIYSRLAHIERQKQNNINYNTRPEWDNTVFAIKSWIVGRNAYHLYVLTYFSERPTDLLVVNFIRDSRAATKIGNFLGYPSKFDKPKKNVNPAREIPVKHINMVKESLLELNIPNDELKYDLYCPSLESHETQVKFPSDSSMLKFFKQYQ
jgi:hypothetical protein